MVQISTSIGFDRPFCAVAFLVKIYDLETKVLALHLHVQSEEFFCRYNVLLIWLYLFYLNNNDFEDISSSGREKIETVASNTKQSLLML